MNTEYVTAYCKCKCIIVNEMEIIKWESKIKYLGNCSNVGFTKEIETDVFGLKCEKCNNVIGKYKKGHVILNKEVLNIEIKGKEKIKRDCECCYDYRNDNKTWEIEEKSRREEERDLDSRIKFELEANEYRRSRAQFTRYISEECFQEDLELEDEINTYSLNDL